MIPALPHITAMAPYALADLTGCNNSSPISQISLSQNESLRPASPQVQTALAETHRLLHLYPDPDWHELRAALGKIHHIPPEHILCGTGSLELIGCIAHAFADRENGVLISAHSYPFFRTAAGYCNAPTVLAPEPNYVVSVDALLAHMTANTRIVFVANPGNPTGTRIQKNELIRLRQGLPETTLLVIDEAYGEFADELNEPVFDMVAKGDTVVLRTFSKAYGLAGMRVGWGLFPPLVAQEVRKLLNPNNISVTSQAAALAALADHAYMRQTCADTKRIASALIADLNQRGFAVPASFTNFVLIPFASEAAARSADHYLRTAGFILRRMGAAGLPHCLRANIADNETMRRLMDVLEAWRRTEAGA